MQQPETRITIRHSSQQQPHPPLTNVQLELLKLYAITVSDEELEEIKSLLAHYFAERLTNRVNTIWEAKGLTAVDMEQWLNDERQ